MNILLVSGHLGLGGVQKMVTILGEELSQRNNVYYYSIDKSELFWNIKKKNHILYGPAKNKINQLLKKIYKYSLIMAGRNFNINIVQSQFVDDLLERIHQKKINVLILTSDYQFAAIPIIKKKFPNLKIISWVHETHESLEHTTRHYRDYFNKGILESDYVVCLVRENYDYFSRLNKHCLIIPNIVSLNNYNKVSDLDSLNISFTSRISFEYGIKGIDVLLEVIKLLPLKYKISFAGGGSPKDEAKFNKRIELEKLSDRISLKGVLKGNELLNHYWDSSIFISTSRSESFSLVILEAMTIGLPIVAFSTSGARYLLDNGKYGILVDQGNVKEFAEQCNRLMCDKALLRHYQNLSLKRAKDFSLDKSMQKWSSLLTE